MRPPGPCSAVVGVLETPQVVSALGGTPSRTALDSGPDLGPDSGSDLDLRVEGVDGTDALADPPVDCLLIPQEPSGLQRDCFELLAEYNPASRRVPVVVLLADGYEHRVADALRAGASECLPRSIVASSPATLLAHVAERIRAARARTGYRAVYDGVSEPLTLHDPETATIVHANRALCDLLGYDRETIHAMRVADFTADIPGYDRSRATELITSATEEGPIGPVEWPLETSDGRRRWVEAHLAPVRIGGRELVLSSATDVTDRRRREREYEQIFDGVNDAITVHDLESAEMLDANETFCELIGYDRETVLGMDIGEFSRTDLGYTTERGREFIGTVGAAGNPKQTEWALETADGDTRWVEVHGTVAEIGGERRFVAIDRDITEAKRREREYEQIFDGVNDSIVVHDPETGEMVDANETFCELIGYDRETVLELGTPGLSVAEEGYTEERAREVISETMDRGEVGPLEWKVETSDGDRRVLEVTATRAEIGGETRHVSMMRDVTERRRREREFEQIFDGVNDLINVYDPETKALIEVNDTTCSLLGYDREEILDRDVEGVSATEFGYTRDRVESMIDRVMSEGEPVEGIEWALRTADGEVVWVEVNATPAVINGQDRFLAIARDITERKDREERVQVLNRVLRHNLRNDMDAVKGYAEMLAEDPMAHRQYAERIQSVADDLVELGAKAREVEEVLTRQETGSVGRLPDVIRESVADVQSRHPGAKIDVDVSGGGIRVNGPILRSVLRELLENAIEHDDADSPRVRVRARPADGSAAVALRIADNGPGIPDHELATLDRAEEAELDHGRGLGLWLVKWGVRRIDGHIEFDSGPEGEGTVAMLYLNDVRP